MALQKVTDGFTIVQSAGTTYEGNSANQTYSLNPALIAAGQTITIVDQAGSNKIELVGGLTITNSIVTSNETQFTLSNGAVVNVRNADTFTFAIGQNTAAGDTTGLNLTFAQFATQILGVTLPAAGAAAVTTTTTSVINTDGTATIGGTTPPATTNITVSSSGSNDASTSAKTYAISFAEYTYTISGFGLDDVLDFDSTETINFEHGSSNSDGILTIEYHNSSSGATANIVLTGLTNETSLNGISSFNSYFGADSLV